MNVRTEAMKKIVVKKRHTIRKSQAQGLLSRLFDQIGDSAKFFHADMIEVPGDHRGCLIVHGQ